MAHLQNESVMFAAVDYNVTVPSGKAEFRFPTVAGSIALIYNMYLPKGN